VKLRFTELTNFFRNGKKINFPIAVVASKLASYFWIVLSAKLGRENPFFSTVYLGLILALTRCDSGFESFAQTYLSQR